VKNGKKAFFLKESAKKQIALEVRCVMVCKAVSRAVDLALWYRHLLLVDLHEHRYDELKKSGKLNQFLNKKRKRNSNKDHKKIPYRREQDM
jgi:hypothetical protein